jgi:peptide subunit release factor 1 (eRF1)
VSEGRVQMLMVHRGFRKSGFRCPDCGILTTMPDEACASCLEPKQPVEDIIALSVSVVLENNGEIEFVQNNDDLQSVGSIGAFLRY